MAVPPTNGTQSGIPRVGRRSPSSSITTAGSTMNSPWAKLMAPAVCHSSANPTAATAKIAPVASPEKLICKNVVIVACRTPPTSADGSPPALGGEPPSHCLAA